MTKSELVDRVYRKDRPHKKNTRNEDDEILDDIQQALLFKERKKQDVLAAERLGLNEREYALHGLLVDSIEMFMKEKE